MKILRILLLAAVVASVDRAVSQPVHTFRVKIGIDRESVDSLGGRERVIRHIEEMFRRVNRAFNYDARFRAIYDFVVDWNAFYIYDGVSADEVMKPHPDHDYLVVMDGYKSDLREVGGGWYGDTIQTVYHSRTHNDRFNSPFEPGAVDGIIHEFGHARGIPDIYAMKVDADKNPVNGRAFHAVRCIMDYPYGEVHWSDYAVHMINMAGGRNVNIDDLVAGALPERIRVEVTGKGCGCALLSCTLVHLFRQPRALRCLGNRPEGTLHATRVAGLPTRKRVWSPLLQLSDRGRIRECENVWLAAAL